MSTEPISRVFPFWSCGVSSARNDFVLRLIPVDRTCKPTHFLLTVITPGETEENGSSHIVSEWNKTPRIDFILIDNIFSPTLSKVHFGLNIDCFYFYRRTCQWTVLLVLRSGEGLLHEGGRVAHLPRHNFGRRCRRYFQLVDRHAGRCA